VVYGVHPEHPHPEHDFGGPVHDRAEHVHQVRGPVLEVRVKDDEVAASGQGRSRKYGRTLAEVEWVMVHDDVVMPEAGEKLTRPIGTPIVDDDQLEGVAEVHAQDIVNCRFDRRYLVVHGH
jgi:hypothetical protein